ncbi:MAG: hypothetical protein ACRENZ_07755 [Thermodesulfobacteriota bacterium]
MFLESSRYFKIKAVDVVTKDGRTVKVVTLRRLPVITGKPTVIKANDRLDIISQRQYNDPTMFWHIADANSELEANNLVKKTVRIISVPET